MSSCKFHELRQRTRKIEGIIFERDAEQYSLLPSYVVELNYRSHKVELDIVKNEFKRLSIIFRERTQAFGKYFERVISVAGTFLKTTVGGI